jgi:5-methylcytosine-specific restriction enzyme subunit McrC
MVVDAKYKPYNNKKISTDDVRQVSGYSRLTSVYKSLGKDPNSIVDCLFIYPDQNLGLKEFKNVNLLDPNRLISGFERIFKIGVQIPIVASENN